MAKINRGKRARVSFLVINFFRFRHLEFGLIDTTGMSEQQRREIPYTIVQSAQSVVQTSQISATSRGDDQLEPAAVPIPRYDDLGTSCVLHSPPAPIEDETGSVVIV